MKIPVKQIRRILNYVKDESSQLENLVLFRTAKLSERINSIEDGIFLVNKLTNESALGLASELEDKRELLKNGYDIEQIIDAYDDFSIDSIKNKILYFTHSDLPYVTSGYTVRTESVIKAFSDHGFDIETLSRWGFPLDRGATYPPKEIPEQFIDLNGIRHNFDPSHKGMQEYQGVAYIKRAVDSMLRKCKSVKPSIIVAASDHVTGITAMVASKILGIPFIYEMRGLWAYTRATNNPGYEESFDFALRLRLEKQCAMEAHRVVVISEALREVVSKWGIAKKKMLLLPNGIENAPQQFKPSKIDKNDLTLGYIGSIVSYEGLNSAIEAINLMKRERKRVPKLIIVGDGAVKNDLEEKVIEYDLGGNVEFRGKIPHYDVDQFYEEVDAIILPRSSTFVTDIIPPLKPLEAISKEKSLSRPI